MDGVSAVASVLTVIEVAVKLSSAAWKLTRDIKGAPGELIDLQDELSRCRTIVADVSVIASKDDDGDPDSTALSSFSSTTSQGGSVVRAEDFALLSPTRKLDRDLELTRSKIEEITRFLQKFMGHNEKHESLRFGRVWWQKHRSEGQRLTQNLRDLTDHLQRRVTNGIWLESKRSAVLASRAHSMIIDSRDQQQQFLMQLASMESQIGFVLQRLSMRDSPQEAGVVEEVLESELDDDLPIYSLNGENLPNTRPADDDDDVRQVDGEEEKGWLLNVACPRETNLALGSTSRQPQRADDLDPIMNGSSSRSSSSTVSIACKCPCHTAIINRKFGSRFTGYINLYLSCLRPACQGQCCFRSGFQLQVLSHAPSWLMHRMVLMTMNANQGPEFELSVPVYLHGSHIAWDAASRCDHQQLRRLISLKMISPRSIDEDGASLLMGTLAGRHGASVEDQITTIRYLLNLWIGSEHRVRGPDGRTVAELLLDETVFDTLQPELRIGLDSTLSDIEAVIDVKQTRLHRCIRDVYLDPDEWEALVEEHLDSIDKPDYLGRTPLMYAVLLRDKGAFDALLKYGANAAVYSSPKKPVSALSIAVSNSGVEYARLLIEHGHPVYHNGSSNGTNLLSLLFYCAADSESVESQIEVLQLLVRAGVDVNQPNDQGRTPLLFAIEFGASLAAIKMLLELGADAHVSRAYGASCLEIACEKNADKVVELFLEWGIPYIFEPQPVDLFNILQRAAWTSNVNIVRVLAAHGLEGLDPDRTTNGEYLPPEILVRYLRKPEEYRTPSPEAPDTVEAIMPILSELCEKLRREKREREEAAERAEEGSVEETRSDADDSDSSDHESFHDAVELATE